MMTLSRCGAAALVVLFFAWLPPAAAMGDSMVLVARPQLQDPIYARTVLVVAPFGQDQHYGFIVNRPTALRLAQMFPQHAPSRAVDDPVFSAARCTRVTSSRCSKARRARVLAACA